MEHTLLNIDSLYDFVYVDSKRFARYLSQLDPNGTLTGIKISASGSLAESHSGKFTAAVVGGQMGSVLTDASGVERQFDPAWTVPLAVLSRLQELGLIHKTILDAQVGNLFITKGYIQVLDIRVLKELWPFVFAHAKKMEDVQKPQGNRHERRAAAKNTGGQPDIEKAIIDGMKHLPHSLQMHMLSESLVLWATLNPENMLVLPEDFLLKHGSAVPGEWHLVGILDSVSPINAMPIWGDLGLSPVSNAMMAAAEDIRVQFGRPAGALAVTPLALFRTVDAKGATIQDQVDENKN